VKSFLYSETDENIMYVLKKIVLLKVLRNSHNIQSFAKCIVYDKYYTIYAFDSRFALVLYILYDSAV